jgi:predicted nucleic acid-binding protein
VTGFAAVLDACVLVPVSLADTLLRIAEREMYRPLWSEKILQETRDAILEVHPDIEPSRVLRRIESMNCAFEDANVVGWEPLVAGLELPDPADRHVLAAAIRGRAEIIVTANLVDFPNEALRPFGIHALSPDAFLVDQLDLDLASVIAALIEQARDSRNPHLEVEDVLNSLDRVGASGFAAEVRRLTSA